ncbi:MAG TPA: hypothetical protein VHH90_05960 [Polyangia bacterium]|nr:hypothetical protein [Polyangia bacterium]
MPGDEERERAQRTAEREREKVFDEPAPDEEIDAAFSATMKAVAAGSRSGELADLLDRFVPLVMAGEVLANLRFADEPFGAAVEQALPSLKRSRTTKKREKLFELAITELADRRTIRQFRSILQRAIDSTALDAAGREGAVAALICLAPVLDGAAPKESPTLQIIFDVQLDEWFERRDAVVRVLDDAGRRLRSGDIEPGDLETIVRRAFADDPAVARTLVDVDEAAEIIDEAMEQVVRVLQARKAPALFTAAETIAVSHVVQQELVAFLQAGRSAEDQKDEAAGRLIAALRRVFDSTLARDICNRLLAEAAHPDGRRSEREFFSSFVGALTANPGFVGSLSFLSTLGRVHVRDEIEREHVVRLAELERWAAPDIEPYCEYLDSAGDGAWLLRVRKVLAGLPPDGLIGGLFLPERRRRGAPKKEQSVEPLHQPG